MPTLKVEVQISGKGKCWCGGDLTLNLDSRLKDFDRYILNCGKCGNHTTNLTLTVHPKEPSPNE